MSFKGVLRNLISSCNIGDYIELKYSATTNTVGEFSDSNETDNELYSLRKTSTEITTSRALVYGDNRSGSGYVYEPCKNPDGKFKAVCINILENFKVFIPDRILQRYISYNTVNSAGMISGDYKINTKKYIGSAKILSYDEIYQYLPTYKEICDDYRYDLDIPSLSHPLGGGYRDSYVAFNSYDGYIDGYDCLEMTSTIIGNNIRYIADYERIYSDSILYVGYDEGLWASIPNNFNKDYVEQTFNNAHAACITNSAIRPLLYLQDNFPKLYNNENDMYGML